MKTRIDLATWPRSEHFEFFKQYDMPFFGITAQSDCTRQFGEPDCRGMSNCETEEIGRCLTAGDGAAFSSLNERP